MTTDDVQIDRRIIQEAKSLIGLGNEVILLAAAGPSTPTHEVLEGVKVERLSSAGFKPDRLSSMVVLAHAKFIKIVNALSTRSQALAGKVSGWPFAIASRIMLFFHARTLRFTGTRFVILNKVALKSCQAQLNVNGAVVRTSSRVQGGSAILAWRVCWLMAVLSNKGLAWTLSALRRIRRPSRDGHLADRTVYFKPDVIHAHDLPQLPAAVEAARRLKVPLIYDAHELYPEICTLTPPQQKRLGQVERRKIRKCDEVITVNPHLANEFSTRYGIDVPNVILNAIDPFEDLHASRRNLFREELGLGEQQKILLFQGWMSPDRGLQELVRAMANVNPDVHLVFMGYGDLVPTLTAIANECDILPRIHFKNAVPQSELLYWTASADAGVIPYQPVDLNHYFCSPNKIFEFIQSRLPIIANDLPYLRDVVAGDNLGVLVQIDTPGSLTAAINTMFDPALGGADRFVPMLIAAQSKYSWQAQETTLFDVYRRVAGERMALNDLRDSPT